MKHNVFLLIAIAICSYSCSNDDTSQVESTNYQPLAIGNYWNYDVQGIDMSERDSLFVAHDTLINGKTYMKMSAGMVPTGFFSTTLNNNSIRVDGGKVYMTGNAGLSLGDFLPLDLEVNDFIILDGNASDNQQLSTMSGSASQDVQGFPLNLNYILTSEAGTFYPSYTVPGGITYANVKSVRLKLNLKITSLYQLGNFPLTVPILNPQNVVVSERFYAPNVGMIYSSTVLSYQLEDFSSFGFELPIPQSGQETQTEILDSYNVD